MSTNRGEMCVLLVNDIQVWAKIGCLEEERLRRQQLLVSVQARFQESLIEKFKDDISLAPCYSKIAGEVVKRAEASEFKLIETLGLTLMSTLRDLFDLDVSYGLKLRKVSPPVERIMGGTEIVLGNWTHI